ncbi:NERD domain-containing protein [Bacillus lacus]|uniref:NERD domain-containing protein n=1 Tax=Metabacillus lacus TaxID=1983721 RepID=A0A7X2M0A0_9BACI|nr:nuclease-related domain-containing protein [Metabacillus lacus]MRX74376.1 NERD domain-containing protein [Metabacillus lacus]
MKGCQLCPYKARTESTELLTLKFLNARMRLSDKDRQLYLNLRKGYEGEKLFDSMTEKIQSECFILNDLLLKQHNTTFQIDSLIIFQEAVYLFEVKNFEGDYYYVSDRLYAAPNSEISNPLNQLNRSESLLRQLLQNLHCSIPIYASVVFINPEFTLYQTPLNKPFIFPTELNRYIKKLNMIPSQLNEKHKILANKLISLHLKDSPFAQLPLYNYEQLQKGITCGKCASLSTMIDGRMCICRECEHIEAAANAVMRSVNEFKFLFPDEKITTNIIHNWCKVVQSKKRIKRILEKNFKIVGVHQWSYYE